jgi:hypothetical protein
MLRVFLLLLVGLLFWTSAGQAAGLSDRLAGRILLQVEQNGEAWYLEPTSLTRRYLGRPADAFNVMRELGLGVAHVELTLYLDSGFPSRLSGRIMLDVERNGEAYYVYPETLRGHYLGRPADAFQVMRELGLGISDNDLGLIAVAAESATPPTPAADTDPAPTGIAYRDETVSVASGEYRVRWLTVSRSQYRPLTATAWTADCDRDCPAQSLADYSAQLNAVAGINGSYFCPPDYASCATSINNYLWPVFDSARDRMFNEDNLKYHERPMVVVNTDGAPSLLRNAKTEFGWSVAEYENQTGQQVAAALGNYPALIDNSSVVVWNEPTLEGGMTTSRVRRGAWGWNETDYLLVVIEAATVPALAEVMQALGAQEAMNLDGGGSAALWLDGEYRVGPGRELPNALLLTPIN